MSEQAGAVEGSNNLEQHDDGTLAGGSTVDTSTDTNTDDKGSTDTSPVTSTEAPSAALTRDELMQLLAENNKSLLESLQPKVEEETDEPPSDPEKVALQSALTSMHEANMKGLSDEHKKLVEELGGESIVNQVTVLAKLKASGVIKSAPASSNTSSVEADTATTSTEKPPRSKLDLSGSTTNKPADTWQQADQAFAAAVAASKR